MKYCRVFRMNEIELCELIIINFKNMYGNEVLNLGQWLLEVREYDQGGVQEV